MKVTLGSDSIMSITPTRSTYNEANSTASVESERTASGNFDQVSLSKEPVGERKFQMELVSRLSVDVRTSTVSSSEIEELRNQVRSGQYHPDAADTAASMLLIGAENTNV